MVRERLLTPTGARELGFDPSIIAGGNPYGIPVLPDVAAELRQLRPNGKRIKLYKEVSDIMAEEFRGDNSLVVWQSLAPKIITANKSDGVIWKRGSIKIRQDFLTREIGDQNLGFAPFTVGWNTGGVNLAVKGWPVAGLKDGYIVQDHNLIYYLAARGCYSEDIEEVFTRLSATGIFGSTNRMRAAPFYSFLAEMILDGKGDEFQTFCVGLVENINTVDGYAVIKAVVEELAEDNTKKPESEKQMILAETLKKLQEKYITWHYQQRSQMVSSEQMQAYSSGNLPNFWEEIFKKSGVRDNMINLFGGDEADEVPWVLNTSLGERKVIPGIVLLMAQAMGYPKEEAVLLAASALYAWGVVVSYDNIIDGDELRKGVPTQPAVEGQADAIDTTTVSLIQLLTQRITDKGLVKKLGAMLIASSRGDKTSRLLTWDNDETQFFEAMEMLVRAFSFAPEHIGEKTGFNTAGRLFQSFLANMYRIEILLNDLEDFSPPSKKKEPGQDIGKRVTLPWRIIKDIATPADWEIVEENWEKIKERKKSSDWKKDENILAMIETVRAIGLKYLPQVAQQLCSSMEPFYREAQNDLEKAFHEGLPAMDEIDNETFQVLKFTLDGVWKRLKQYQGEQESEQEGE